MSLLSTNENDKSTRINNQIIRSPTSSRSRGFKQGSKQKNLE